MGRTTILSSHLLLFWVSAEDLNLGSSFQTSAGARILILSSWALCWDWSTKQNQPFSCYWNSLGSTCSWPCMKDKHSKWMESPHCGRKVLEYYTLELLGKNCRFSHSYLALGCWSIWGCFVLFCFVPEGFVSGTKKIEILMSKFSLKNSVLHSILLLWVPNTAWW